MQHITSEIHAMLQHLGTLAVLCCIGCQSGITAREVDQSKEGETPGIRYYLAAPYLVIEEQAGPKWDARLELAIDPTHEFAVEPYTRFAASTSSIDINADGTIKSFKLNQDGTTVPSALVTSLKDLELKRLEIEQKKTEARQRPVSGTKVTAMGAAGERSFHIYRVQGEQLVGADGKVANVPIPAPDKP